MNRAACSKTSQGRRMLPAVRTAARTTAITAAITATLTLLAWPAHAEPGVDEPPLPGTPPVLSVPELQEARLANGVRVVVAPRPGLPLVTLALNLGQGALADPAGRTGLAALTNDLRTRGATHQGQVLGATALARRAEALGASLSSGTGWQGSSLSMTVASSRLEAAAALLCDVMRHPSLRVAELDRLKAQTADGLKFKLSDPSALASSVADRSAWGRSAYGNELTLESLGRIRHADVLAQQRRQARPEQATLVLAGDISLAQAQALAQRYLGDWRASGPASPAPQPQPAELSLPATVLVNLPGADQSSVTVLVPMSVGAQDAQRRVAQVAAAVLGGGYSARINEEVRVKRGLSYGASAGVALYPEGGVLSANAQTKHASAAEVATLMHEQIRQLSQTAPTPEELAARQATLVGSFSRQLETTSGLASLALDLVRRGRPLSEAQSVAPSLLAVSAEQVRDFAARHWARAQLRTVVVGDVAAGGEALKALDAQALLLQAPELKLDSPTLRP